MSHVTEIKLRVRDLESLREACEALGLEFMEGQTNYCWWGQFMNDSSAYGGHDPKTFGKCEHAIRIKGDKPRNGSYGPWEIGVVKALDGDGYELLYDAYGSAGRRLTERVGSGANNLRKEYAVSTAMRQAKKRLGPKGWTTERIDQPNGGVKVRLRKR